MIVKVVWEFDADVEDLDTKFVDIFGLAKDSAKRELQHMLENNELCAEDFTYEMEDQK